MERKWLIGCILFLGLASYFTFPMTAQTAPPEVITLKYCEFRPFQGMKFSDRFRASPSRTEATKKTLLEIEKRTGGRIKHIYQCDQSHFNGMDPLRAIKLGKYELGGGPNVLFQPVRFPIWQCFQLMFLGGPDPWVSLKAWNELAFTNSQLRQEFDCQGMKFLGTFSYPSALISRKPLSEPKNLYGLKLRATGPAAKWVVSLGGTVVPIVNYSVGEALQERIIDGIIGYPYVLYKYHSQDHCKILIHTPMANSVIYDTWMNLGAWRRIPGDLQKVYEETCRETYPRMAIQCGRAEVAKLERAFKDSGVRFLDLTPGQYGKWKGSSVFLAKNYIKKMARMGVDGKKIIAQFEKLYRKYQQQI